ncbi:MAG: hypothetical protein HC827_07985 [Cyanobacteria bacterium RM1_2_2]|nr:hypothetical protein [Cyanobacteria bacterium RM1_2_2]
MFNNRFIQALGVVAACFLLLKGASWILSSLLRISAGFGYWLRFTLMPHAWQIAIAAGLIYLLLTALTNGRRNSF